MPLKKRPHISYGDACVEKLGVVGIDLFIHHQEEIHILYEGETLKESWMLMTNLFENNPYPTSLCCTKSIVG